MMIEMIAMGVWVVANLVTSTFLMISVLSAARAAHDLHSLCGFMEQQKRTGGEVSSQGQMRPNLDLDCPCSDDQG